MESLFELIANHSGVFAPILMTWAVVALYVPGRDADWRYSQGLFFGSLLAIAFLTIRTVIDHDQQWLTNAASLGFLVVCGALKRPTESTGSVISGL
jgi:hypothetical protein